eukprot:6479406-Amphidinium_carterae.1
MQYCCGKSPVLTTRLRTRCSSIHPLGEHFFVESLQKAIVSSHGWALIAEDFKKLSAEEKSKQWIKNRAKKLESAAATAAPTPTVAIEWTEQYGRVLIAQKQLPCFSIIVAEPPLIIGASASNVGPHTNVTHRV